MCWAAKGDKSQQVIHLISVYLWPACAVFCCCCCIVCGLLAANKSLLARSLVLLLLLVDLLLILPFRALVLWLLHLGSSSLAGWVTSWSFASLTGLAVAAAITLNILWTIKSFCKFYGRFAYTHIKIKTQTKWKKKAQEQRSKCCFCCSVKRQAGGCHAPSGPFGPPFQSVLVCHDLCKWLGHQRVPTEPIKYPRHATPALSIWQQSAAKSAKKKIFQSTAKSEKKASKKKNYCGSCRCHCDIVKGNNASRNSRHNCSVG